MSGSVTLVVTLQVDGDVETAANLIAEYLASPECPLEADYSRHAEETTGYDGPFITGVTVSERGLVLAQTDDDWGQP